MPARCAEQRQWFRTLHAMMAAMIAAIIPQRATQVAIDNVQIGSRRVHAALDTLRRILAAVHIALSPRLTSRSLRVAVG